MLYTKLTKKALTISFNAHKNQLDKSGLPYVFHPFHIAEQMNDEYTTCVALLHDVVEDTDITLDDLAEQGFPEEIIAAIDIMTHQKNVPYFDYIERIKTNLIATTVKLEDLAHNMDMSRMENPEPFDFERQKKYQKAVQILKNTEI